MKRFVHWLLRRRFDDEASGVEWWTVSMTFPAHSETEAEAIWDRMQGACCEGFGKGRLHRCHRQCASSMKPEPIEDEPPVQRFYQGVWSFTNAPSTWTWSTGTTA